DGPRVRPVTGARPGRVSRGRLGIPRRRRRAGAVQPALRRGNPGPRRHGGFQAGARGRADRRRAHPLAPARAQAARRTPGRAGDRRRLGGVPDRRQARARAPARCAGDRPAYQGGGRCGPGRIQRAGAQGPAPARDGPGRHRVKPLVLSGPEVHGPLPLGTAEFLRRVDPHIDSRHRSRITLIGTTERPGAVSTWRPARRWAARTRARRTRRPPGRGANWTRRWLPSPAKRAPPCASTPGPAALPAASCCVTTATTAAPATKTPPSTTTAHSGSPATIKAG